MSCVNRTTERELHSGFRFRELREGWSGLQVHAALIPWLCLSGDRMAAITDTNHVSPGYIYLNISLIFFQIVASGFLF